MLRMVQAKPEDGNWRTVPVYKAGMDVNYRNDDGVQECKIITVHHDDPLELYYTVRLQNRKEKQTEYTHVMLRMQDGKMCDEEGMTRMCTMCFLSVKMKNKEGQMDIKYLESLPPKKKAQILENNAAAHQKYQESLSPKKKTHILEDNAAAHQKHRESLPHKKKAQICWKKRYQPAPPLGAVP
jgi:hypothetical protein